MSIGATRRGVGNSGGRVQWPCSVIWIGSDPPQIAVRGCASNVAIPGEPRNGLGGASPSVDRGRGRPIPAPMHRERPLRPPQDARRFAQPVANEPRNGTKWDSVGLCGVRLLRVRAGTESTQLQPRSFVGGSRKKRVNGVPLSSAGTAANSTCADKTRPALTVPDQAAAMILFISAVFVAMASSCFGRLDRDSATTR